MGARGFESNPSKSSVIVIRRVGCSGQLSSRDLGPRDLLVTATLIRKAYGIGLCSVEELGALRSEPSPNRAVARTPTNGNGLANTQPRLRDRLCLLIRQHRLDPTLVKRYAADFCGTQQLREASRELVESFINALAEQANKDRDGLICKLNSYAHSETVQS